MGGRDRGDLPIAPTGTPGDSTQQLLGNEANAIRLAQYQGADRRVAAPQQTDYQRFTNPDGTGTVKFNDGTSVTIDNWKDKRPLEVKNKDGSTVTFTYGDDGGTSYKITGADGKVTEEGSKGAKDDEFKTKHYKDGKEVPDKNHHITDIKLTADGQLDFVGKDGLHHEHQRSGNKLLRDTNGRMLSEHTPGDRVTEYTYQGDDKQPQAFNVKDSKGNIIEHGVKGDKGWTVYKPGKGEAGLDPKNLEDPAKAVNDAHDKVTDVQVNQRNGMRVETHANGDRTWSTDKHEYRMNPGGSMEILDKLPPGSLRLVSHRNAAGDTTTYNYNDKGQLTTETTTKVDGSKSTLTRQGDTDNWKGDDGKTVKIKAEILGDGSVQMTYPDDKRIRTEGASGVETEKTIGSDGKARVAKVTDTLGRSYNFTYDEKSHDLSKVEITPPASQLANTPYLKSITWERKGDDHGQPKWELTRNIDKDAAMSYYLGKMYGRPVSSDDAKAFLAQNSAAKTQFETWVQSQIKPGDKTHFIGRQEVLDDGSIVKTDGKTGERAQFSSRGIKLDLPKEEQKK